MQVLRLLFVFVVCVFVLSACLSRRDALVPIVTIYDPPNGATQSLGKPTVRGYAMDDNGIVSIRVNNTDLLEAPVYADEKGKKLIQFFFEISQQSGEFAADITVEDRAGNVQTLPYKLVIDVEDPTVEASAERLSSSRLRVTGIARDNDAVKSVTVEGVAQAFIAAPEQAFNVDVTTSGEATIVVEDRAGNQVTLVVSP